MIEILSLLADQHFFSLYDTSGQVLVLAMLSEQTFLVLYKREAECNPAPCKLCSQSAFKRRPNESHNDGTRQLEPSLRLNISASHCRKRSRSSEALLAISPSRTSTARFNIDRGHSGIWRILAAMQCHHMNAASVREVTSRRNTLTTFYLSGVPLLHHVPSTCACRRRRHANARAH